MDFREMLLTVGQALGRHETNALAFLCVDILKQSPCSAESPMDIFSRLEKQDILSEDQPYLLADLLSIIGHLRLLREFDLKCRLSTTRSLISPYREMLYKLSEDITEEELKAIKFLLTDDLQRLALEPNVSILDVFLAMERKELLNSTDLSRLERILERVCPALQKHINTFKASQGASAQEKELNRLREKSSSEEPDQEKIPKSVPESLSGGMPEAQPFEDPDLQQLSSLHLSSTPMENVTTRSPIGSLTSSSETKTSESGTQLAQAAKDDEEDHSGPPAYAMTGGKRGFCCIFNNFDFSSSRGKHENREGTDVDAETLTCVFTWLGFQVEVLRDSTKDQMLSAMQELASRDHRGMDCVACVVLSHGLDGGVYGVDGQEVKLSELMDHLSGSQCHQLRGKPKLFFVQACRGTKRQRAVSIQDDGHQDLCSDAQSYGLSDWMPCAADFLAAMATVPTYVSLRHRKQGSWFIQSLCRNLVLLVPRGQDLVSILTKVNNDVSQMSDPNSDTRQMPQPTFSLRGHVVFPVPKDPPPELPASL